MYSGHVICSLIVSSLLSEFLSAEYSPVLSWDVCSPSRIVVTLTGGADGGIIYIRGYGSACKQDTALEETVHEFEFETCGIGKAETYFTIIVQKNPLYQTGGDLQESLLCIYDLSDISVGNGVNAGDKDDDDGVNKTVKPAATMKLYKDGVDVSGSDVKLTDLVTMTIQLDDEYIEDFDIKAKSCTANFIDITTDSCATDIDLFPNFEHVTQGVVTSSFGAFRTTDLGGGYVEMVFTCTLQVCRSLCVETTCGNEAGWGRRKRAVAEDLAFEDLNVGTSMSVGTDIDVTPKEKDAKDNVCIANIAFIAGMLAVLSVLVTSMSLTTIATGKLLKRTEQLRKLTNDHEVQKPAPRMERKQSVSIMSTNTEAVTVRTAQNYNCKTRAGQIAIDSDRTNANVTKRNTLKSQSSESVMYNPSEVNHTGNQANRATEAEADSTKVEETKLETIPEDKTISEADLNQLKQCRDMLKMMGVKEILRKK